MGNSKRPAATFRVAFGVAALVTCVTLFTSAHAGTNTPQERANMKLVTEFFAALDRGAANHDLKQQISNIAARFLSPDYMEHATAQPFGPGREGLIRMFENQPSAPAGAPAPVPPKVLALMASEDLVIRLDTPGAARSEDKVPISVDMYRIQSGKLVEHWQASSNTGVAAPGAPAPTATNSAR